MSHKFETIPGLPQDNLAATLDDIKTMPECHTEGHQRFLEAADYIMEHSDDLETRPVGIHLLGDPGTGKTFAAMAIARAIYEERPDSTFVRFMHSSQFRHEGIAAGEENVVTGDLRFDGTHRTPLGGPKGTRGVVVLDDVQNFSQDRKQLFRTVDQVTHNGGLLLLAMLPTQCFTWIDHKIRRKNRC